MVFRAVDRPVAEESECQRRLDTRAGPGMAELYYYVEATHGVGCSLVGGRKMEEGCFSADVLQEQC